MNKYPEKPGSTPSSQPFSVSDKGRAAIRLDVFSPLLKSGENIWETQKLENNFIFKVGISTFFDFILTMSK